MTHQPGERDAGVVDYRKLYDAVQAATEILRFAVTGRPDAVVEPAKAG